MSLTVGLVLAAELAFSVQCQSWLLCIRAPSAGMLSMVSPGGRDCILLWLHVTFPACPSRPAAAVECDSTPDGCARQLHQHMC